MTNNDFETFKKDLLASSFFKSHILKNHDVIAVTLGGSRSLDLDEESSDFDLTVYIKDQTKPLEDCELLRYKNTIVHWYYQNVENINTLANVLPVKDSFVWQTHLFWALATHKTEKIIYCTNRSALENIYTLLESLKSNFIDYYLFYYKEIIQHLAAKSELKLEDQTKVLYRLGLVYYELFDIPQNKALLFAIKQKCPSRFKSNQELIPYTAIEKLQILSIIKQLAKYLEQISKKF